MCLALTASNPAESAHTDESSPTQPPTFCSVTDEPSLMAWLSVYPDAFSKSNSGSVSRSSVTFSSRAGVSSSDVVMSVSFLCGLKREVHVVKGFKPRRDLFAGPLVAVVQMDDHVTEFATRRKVKWVASCSGIGVSDVLRFQRRHQFC